VERQESNVFPRTLKSTKLCEMVHFCDGNSTLLVTFFILHPSDVPELPEWSPWITSFTQAIKDSFLKAVGQLDLSPSAVKVVPFGNMYHSQVVVLPKTPSP
jgi:hypothetical protein